MGPGPQSVRLGKAGITLRWFKCDIEAAIMTKCRDTCMWLNPTGSCEKMTNILFPGILEVSDTTVLLRIWDQTVGIS